MNFSFAATFLPRHVTSGSASAYEPVDTESSPHGDAGHRKFQRVIVDLSAVRQQQFNVGGQPRTKFSDRRPTAIPSMSHASRITMTSCALCGGMPPTSARGLQH